MLPFLLATLGTAALNSSNSKDYCYSARIRSTVLQGLPFGGVPTVLALDFMCFLVSVLIPSSPLPPGSWTSPANIFHLCPIFPYVTRKRGFPLSNFCAFTQARDLPLS